MIEDLKADSARWDSERRSQTSRNAPGGIQGSRDGSNYTGAPSSNSHAVQYRYSETHQSRQNHGPTEHPPYQQQPQQQQDHYSRDSFDGGNRYQGAGSGSYNNTATGNFPTQQTYAPPATGGGPGYGYQSGPPVTGADPRYPSPANQPNLMNPGYQAQEPYMTTGANLNQRGGYPPNDGGFSGQRGNTSGSGPQQPMYTTSGPGQQGYPQPSGAPYQYSNQGPHPGSGQQYSSSIQPQDPFYGRGQLRTTGE